MLRLQIHIANSMVSQQINSQGSKFNTKRRNFSKTESFVQKRWRIVRYWKTKHIWVWRFWSVRLLSSGRIAMLPQLSSSAAYATQGHPKNCLRSWRKFLTKCMKYNHMCVFLHVSGTFFGAEARILAFQRGLGMVLSSWISVYGGLARNGRLLGYVICAVLRSWIHGVDQTSSWRNSCGVQWWELHAGRACHHNGALGHLVKLAGFKEPLVTHYPNLPRRRSNYIHRPWATPPPFQSSETTRLLHD